MIRGGDPGSWYPFASEANGSMRARAVLYSSRAPARASLAAGPSPEDSDLFEEQYQKLGRHKGPHSTREVQEKTRRFWIEAGAEGAAGLLSRIRDEHSIDVLDAVAEIVGEIGKTDEAAVAACLGVLARDPSEEQETVALTALRWMPPPP